MEGEITRLQELERKGRLIDSDKKYLLQLERTQRRQRGKAEACDSIYWHPSINPEGRPPSGKENYHRDDYDSSNSDTDSEISDVCNAES